MSGTPVLELRGIAKEYAGNRVVKGVDLQVLPGEIHALVGENGAGKSTLMNILFGMPVIHSTGGYSGEIRLDGREVRFAGPSEAMTAGIGMVHQEFMLIGGFSVAENIKLNREPLRPNFLSRFAPKLATLDRRKIDSDARAALDQVGLDLDTWTHVQGLPVGHMQFVEIARELDKENLRLLVFDEPTAVLTESEADRLLQVMQDLSARGIAILFITHRLHEVMAVAGRITVLRDGEVVARMDRSNATLEGIAEAMVGRKLDMTLADRRPGPGPESSLALDIRNLEVDMPGEAVHDLTLAVRRGEILGLGGLAGYGKVGVANGLMGIQPARGTVMVNGRPLKLNDPAGSLAERMAFVSEDRRGVGIMPEESIELNMVLPSIRVQRRFLRRVLPGVHLLDQKVVRGHANRMIRDLDVRTTGPAQSVGRLSGGNQQKVCVARAMTLEPEILLVSEPTRGIDIGAKKLVLDLIVALNRKQGVTVLVTSSELAELRGICDRIAIVTRGKVHAILDPDAPDAHYGLAMAGEQMPS
ncbi:MAG: sugar ABC transporter ATP-binding protein [Candidatus Eisenbacteria bacterium]|nr:sugar ABC transporter ATP-binding protein [Candidatus Eisenbacteria bacterium]